MTGGNGCNVFWRVPASAVVGGSSTFVGNIFANTSIAVQSGATVRGRVLANTGAVTLASAHVGGGCAGGGIGNRLPSCAYNADTGQLNGGEPCTNGERVHVWCDKALVELWGIAPDGKGYSLHDFNYGDLIAAGANGITVHLGAPGVVWMNVQGTSGSVGSFATWWGGGIVALGNYPWHFDTAYTYAGVRKTTDFQKRFTCPIPGGIGG